MRLFRRRRPNFREAWVTLLDHDFQPVSRRIPVAVDCDPFVFRAECVLSAETSVVQWVRCEDAHGNIHDQHVSHLTAAH